MPGTVVPCSAPYESSVVEKYLVEGGSTRMPSIGALQPAHHPELGLLLVVGHHRCRHRPRARARALLVVTLRPGRAIRDGLSERALAGGSAASFRSDWTVEMIAPLDVSVASKLAVDFM
jgi:hypothetical protein